MLLTQGAGPQFDVPFWNIKPRLCCCRSYSFYLTFAAKIVKVIKTAKI